MKIIVILAMLLLLAGCMSHTPPANFWGGVGFGYKANKIGKNSKKLVGTTAGFEKQLGGGFGVGAEVAVKR